MESRRARMWAVAVVLGATVGFAFKGVLARFAYAEGVNVTGLLLVRAALATPLLWLFGLAFRQAFARQTRLDLLKAFACGCLFLVSASLDFLAIERLGAGPSRVILFVYPLLVLVMEALRLWRPPARQQLWAFALAWGGLLVVSADSWQRGADLAAVGFGLLAALSHATYLTLTQGLARRMGSVPFTVLSNTGTAAGIAVYVLAVAPAGAAVVTADGALWLGLLALFCTALPALLMVEGVRRMGAGPSSLLSLAGPVITLAAAYLLLGEALTPAKVVGASLVIGAVGWHVAQRAGGARGDRRAYLDGHSTGNRPHNAARAKLPV